MRTIGNVEENRDGENRGVTPWVTVMGRTGSGGKSLETTTGHRGISDAKS